MDISYILHLKSHWISETSYILHLKSHWISETKNNFGRKTDHWYVWGPSLIFFFQITALGNSLKWNVIPVLPLGGSRTGILNGACTVSAQESTGILSSFCMVLNGSEWGICLFPCVFTIALIILNGDPEQFLHGAEWFWMGHMLIPLCVYYSFNLSPFVFIYEEDKVLHCLVQNIYF